MRRLKINKMGILLLLLVVFLLGSVFYISFYVNGKKGAQTAPLRAKAQDSSFNKTITISSPTPTPQITITNQPTITQIPTATTLPLVSPTLIPTVISPTTISQLPETGYINNLLVFFSVGSLALMLSFLF